MKQLFIFLCCIALVALGNAQVLSKISEKEKNILLNSNPEVKALVENLAAQKRVPGIKYPNFPAAETGSGRITLENANGKEDLTIIIFKMTDSAKKEDVFITFFKNNTTNKVKVFAEDNSTEYTLEYRNRPPGYKLLKWPIRIPMMAQRSSSDCFTQFKKANGPANCSSCINCVNNCWSQNKKWKRISCALSNCSSSCLSCVTSVYNFVCCVFN